MKKIALALLIFFAIERFCHFQTEGFVLSKMILDAPPSQHHDLFSSPLTFIGAGNQYYAFETADHQHVIKFMKFSRRRPLPWLEKIPLPSIFGLWKSHYLAERAKRLANLEKSGRLALKHLSEEAGLTFISLSKSITLIDKLGIRHNIDLSQTRFFVQKKATPFTVYFHQKPSRELISSYIQTVASQCRKGICNLDPLERNFGVADGRVILMDIGSLLAHEKLKTSAGQQREIFLELLPLRTWLQHHHPEYLPVFDVELKKLLQ